MKILFSYSRLISLLIIMTVTLNCSKKTSPTASNNDNGDNNNPPVTTVDTLFYQGFESGLGTFDFRITGEGYYELRNYSHTGSSSLRIGTENDPDYPLREMGSITFLLFFNNLLNQQKSSDLSGEKTLSFWVRYRMHGRTELKVWALSGQDWPQWYAGTSIDLVEQIEWKKITITNPTDNGLKFYLCTYSSLGEGWCDIDDILYTRTSD